MSFFYLSLLYLVINSNQQSLFVIEPLVNILFYIYLQYVSGEASVSVPGQVVCCVGKQVVCAVYIRLIFVCLCVAL